MLANSPGQTLARRKITDHAAATLESWLDQLQKGQISFGELPFAVEAWLHAGYAYGRAERQAEIDNLEREVNRLGYLAFHTPGQRRDMLLARLDSGLATATPEQWDALEAALHRMAGTQLNIDHHEHSARTGNMPADGVSNEPGNPRTRKAA